MTQYNAGQFFTEHASDHVKGFTILTASDGRYHLGEKWLASEDDEHSKSEDTWMDYWISERDLQQRVDADKCEPSGELTDDQYTEVCRATGQRYDT